MIISRQFGNAVSSFGLGLLNAHLNCHDSPGHLFFSPIAIMHSLDLLRSFYSDDSLLKDRIGQILRYPLEDSEIVEILDELAKIAKSQKGLFTSSVWLKRKENFCFDWIKQMSPSNKVCEVNRLHEKFSEISRHINKHFETKIVNLSNPPEDIEDILAIHSIAFLVLDFDDYISESHLKFDGVNMVELMGNTDYYEHSDFESIKVSVNGGNLYGTFVVPKNELSCEKVLSVLSDPVEWEKARNAKKKRTRLIFPELYVPSNGTMGEPKLGQYRISPESAQEFRGRDKMMHKLKCHVVHTSFLQMKSEVPKVRSKNKCELEKTLTKKFVFFLHHSKSRAMLFAGIVDPPFMAKELKTRKKGEERYRAGKSPPRGDLSHTLDFHSTISGEGNERSGKRDDSIIRRNLIPCPAMSETGGCTYGRKCRFSHEIVAIA